jgi:mxaD protein
MTEVSVSKRYDVPAEAMWSRIGDPLALAAWHPAVQTTEAVEGGRVRVNTTVSGDRVVESIVDRGERHYTFTMDETPLPFADFVSTIGVTDDGADGCVVVWRAKLSPDGVSEPDAAELVSGFFQAGLDTL